MPNYPEKTKTYTFEVVTLGRRGIEASRRREEARGYGEDLGSGIELEMVEIPGGEFLMGSPVLEAGRDRNEGPKHRVEVPKFYMGRFQVTQEQYEAVMGVNPSHFTGLVGGGLKRPVEKVSWNEAKEYCDRLTKATGREYRLPSEAEWEYACRGGTETPFHFGKTISTDVANYNGGYTYGSRLRGEDRGVTLAVGRFPANDYGLHDLHGNVWEWCEDLWHENYKGAPTDGSPWLSGPNQGDRVLRGGSWFTRPRRCRCAARFRNDPSFRYNNYGFRVACSDPRT